MYILYVYNCIYIYIHTKLFIALCSPEFKYARALNHLRYIYHKPYYTATKKDRTVGNLRIMEETSLITSFKLCSGALLWTPPERLLVYAISLQGGALSGNS